MAVDKNKAILDFISTYSGMATSPIFINFINAKNNDVQFITDSNEVALNHRYVDGSVMKRHTFSIMITKAITDRAIAKDLMTNGNIDDIAEIQSFMDWINEQGYEHIYPDFGEDCVIEEMHTTAENPDLTGLNTEVSPALALYSMEIAIDYIDYSRTIWS